MGVDVHSKSSAPPVIDNIAISPTDEAVETKAIDPKPALSHVELADTTADDRLRLQTQKLSGAFPLIAEFLDAGFATHIAEFRDKGVTLGPNNVIEAAASLSQLNQAQLEQVRDALVRKPTPHPMIKELGRDAALKGKASVDKVLRLLTGRAQNADAVTPICLREVNVKRRGLEKEHGALLRQEAKLLDGRDDEVLYPDEKEELVKLRADIESHVAQIEQLTELGRGFKALRGEKFLDQFGVHAGAGLSIGMPGVWSAGADPLGTVSRMDKETGYRSAEVHGVARGSFLGGWGRYTKGVGAGAGASYGWLYGGGDELLGKWAGVWIPAVGGFGVAENKERDEANFCIQLAVPVIPPTGLTPGLFVDLDLFIEHSSVKHVVKPISWGVDKGIAILKPILDPVHRGFAKVGDAWAERGRARRAAQRLADHGGVPPPEPKKPPETAAQRDES